RELAELDFEAVDVSGEARLLEIVLVGVEPEHPFGAAPLHLHGIEAGVAADIQHRLAGQVGWNDFGEAAPFHVGIVAEKMRRRRRHALEIEVVKPRAERIDTALDLVAGEHFVRHAMPPPNEPAAAIVVSGAVAARNVGRDSAPSWLAASSAMAVR